MVLVRLSTTTWSSFDEKQHERSLGLATLNIIHKDLIWKRCTHTGSHKTWCSNTDKGGLSSTADPPQSRHHRFLQKISHRWQTFAALSHAQREVTGNAMETPWNSTNPPQKTLNCSFCSKAYGHIFWDSYEIFLMDCHPTGETTKNDRYFETLTWLMHRILGKMQGKKVTQSLAAEKVCVHIPVTKLGGITIMRVHCVASPDLGPSCVKYTILRLIFIPNSIPGTSLWVVPQHP